MGEAVVHVLQRDAMVRMHQQAGTRAGNHRRHTRRINASPPTQEENVARAMNGNPPNQADAQESNQDTSHRILCHQGTRHRYGSTAPTTGATETYLALTQLKLRRRGNPPAPDMTPRHCSAGALGPNKEYKSNGT